MPIMTYQVFESRTSVTLVTRGSTLKRIGNNLKEYIRNPDDNALQNLWNSLSRWQSGHELDPQDRESWMADRRNAKSAISDLSNWVKRKMNEDAIIAFKRAASHIHRIYGPAMDDLYRESMSSIFINSEVDSTEPMTSLIHWKSDAKWQNRLVQMGWNPSQGKSNGLTSPWDGPMLAATSRGVFAATRGNTAPLNRIVEVSELDHHTLCHELLHWVTHEAFRVRFANMADVNLRKYIIEGLTEFLTRKALDEWDKGGYTDLVPLWRKMTSDNTVVRFDKLAAAYFRGSDLKEFEQVITDYTKKDKDYQKALREAFIAGIKRAVGQ